MSAQCPQTVPRKPANVGEGQRNLDVSLTWLFALTEALIGVDCEVVCEADTELITQRSQVQILPPLQVKLQVIPEGTGSVNRVGGPFLWSRRCHWARR
jgi:hypothetical protein